MSKDDGYVNAWAEVMSKLKELGLTEEQIAIQALSLAVTLSKTSGMEKKEFDERLLILWRKATEEMKKMEKPKAKSFGKVGVA